MQGPAVSCPEPAPKARTVSEARKHGRGGMSPKHHAMITLMSCLGVTLSASQRCGISYYEFLLFMNRVYNGIRHKMGKDYWLLSSCIKTRVNNANRHIAAFENLVADYARKRGLDGVVCGHIHQPRLKQQGEVLYCNDGDWVEHCTALVESHEGQLSLVHWSNLQATLDEHRSDLCISGDRELKQYP